MFGTPDRRRALHPLLSRAEEQRVHSILKPRGQQSLSPSQKNFQWYVTKELNNCSVQPTHYKNYSRVKQSQRIIRSKKQEKMNSSTTPMKHVESCRNRQRKTIKLPLLRPESTTQQIERFERYHKNMEQNKVTTTVDVWIEHLTRNRIADPPPSKKPSETKVKQYRTEASVSLKNPDSWQGTTQPCMCDLLSP